MFQKWSERGTYRMRENTSQESIEINQIYEAHSLMEMIGFIKKFSEEEQVWFRGHASSEYELLPTLYRGKSVDFIKDKNYNSMHMAEQMRIQQYYAKDYPFIKNSGHNTLEWLGMGQHFGMNTRFLDWSGSAIHSTVFALEKYFESRDYEGSDMPCLWILKPQKLNQRILERFFCEEWQEKYRRHYFQDMLEVRSFEKLVGYITNHAEELRKVFMDSNSKNKWKHMDYIFNVSYFDQLLEVMKTNPQLAFSQDVMNPVFLFLAMVYIDGVSTEDKLLDSVPLAIIHPLNNERIREQRGVFTIFPFPNKEDYKEAGESLEYMRMEYNPYLKGTLCKIALLRPRKICEELRTIGVHRSWLYNEPEYITKEIESGL